MFGAALRSGQKPEMEQRRHFRYSRFERVSLLRFFARLQRNEVPPRIGANSNKQENTTYAERPREQKDSTLSPHSPRAAPLPPDPTLAAVRTNPTAPTSTEYSPPRPPPATQSY